MAYTKTSLKEKSIHQFKVTGEFSAEDLSAISSEAMTAAKDESAVNFFVLDLGPNDIGFKMLRSLTLLGTELRSNGKKLCVLAEQRSVHHMITSEGLSGVVVPISSLNELLNPPGGAAETKKARTTIDVGFINPFIEGVIHVFKVQCGLECVPEKPFLKDDGDGRPSADIAGVIGISNPKFMGTISICFSERMFLMAMSKMFGEEFSEITKDLEDGAGETLNMIFGHAKRILNERGYSLDKALPTVVRGKGVSLNHMSDQSTIILPFKAGDAGFYMEICTQRK